MYLEINIIISILLLIMLVSLREKKLSRRNLDQLLFMGLVLSNLFIVLFDSGMWLLDGTNFLFAKQLNVFCTVMYFILNPLVFFIWVIYTDYKLNRSRKYLVKRMPIYSVMFFIHLLLVLASFKTKWLFSISASNEYVRGPLFMITILIGMCYLGYAIFLSIKEIRRREWEGHRRAFYYYIVFPVLLLLIMIAQLSMYGLSIVWASITMVLMIIFTNVQKDEISTDYLTGLYNRRSLDNLLDLKISKNRKDSRLFLALIDVDDFKIINDTQGHNVGDMALIQIASILRRVCKDPDDLIVRLGGDEFLIAGERESVYEIEYIRNDLQHRIERFNKRGDRSFHLSISVGFSLFGGPVKSADDLINEADQRMYAHKQTKKQPR